MKATRDTVVKITYELRTEPEGEIMDFADSDSPLTFLFGHKQLLDKFESHLEGMTAGNSFSFEISPVEGYGEYDKEAIVPLDKNAFVVGGKLQEELLFVGNYIPLQDQNGNRFEGKVAEVNSTQVLIDMNHPMAGKTLYFNGQVVEVRQAEPVEIEHGHVHGEGGHHH